MSKHKEAFCLMRYECEACIHREVIWNSRDGVTPFGIACPSCGCSEQHVDFYMDTYSPNHKLNKFQRFFRDGTEQEARIILYRRCEFMEEQGYDHGEASDKAFVDKVIAAGTEFPEGWPIIDVYLGDLM